METYRTLSPVRSTQTAFSRRRRPAENLKDELKAFVASGKLIVRDPLTLGPHPLAAVGAPPQAVVFPWDLRSFVECRGIVLLLKRHGSGPDLWTIDNAVESISDSEGWHESARRTLREQLLAAANAHALTPRHPHTELPYQPNQVRTYYDLFLTTEINTWLEAQGVRFRLTPVASMGPNEKTRSNEKKWDDYSLQRLLDEYRQPGMTQERLATKYGVKRQRISALLRDANEKFGRPRSSLVDTGTVPRVVKGKHGRY